MGTITSKCVIYYGKDCWLTITPKGNEYYSYTDEPPTEEMAAQVDDEIEYAASLPVMDYDLDDSDSDGYGWENKELRNI